MPDNPCSPTGQSHHVKPTLPLKYGQSVGTPPLEGSSLAQCPAFGPLPCVTLFPLCRVGYEIAAHIRLSLLGLGPGAHRPGGGAAGGTKLKASSGCGEGASLQRAAARANSSSSPCAVRSAPARQQHPDAEGQTSGTSHQRGPNRPFSNSFTTLSIVTPTN